MRDINDTTYKSFFQDVFTWFLQHVHTGEYLFDTLNLSGTSRKLIELKNPHTGNVFFRVLLKMTFDSIDLEWKPVPNVRDLGYLFNTESPNTSGIYTARQVCFIQVDRAGNPKAAILYTYSPDDQQYHTVRI